MATNKILDSFSSKKAFSAAGKNGNIYALQKLEEDGHVKISNLPYSIRVLLENVLRNEDGKATEKKDILGLCDWNGQGKGAEIAYIPSRVVMQDFTGVPAVVDLAAMRDAMASLGGDPANIQPVIPADLVIDHSVQVDRFGTAESADENAEIEFGRNRERYEFLRWGQKAFDNFRVVPPDTGIVHQINLEYLSPVIFERVVGEETLFFPDSVVGTDSHTTMINGIGVFGWGVGGIEAEAVMMGQPYFMLTPEVVGFKLSGKLPEGITATDLVLTVVEMLREKGVVGKFVEFYGDGLDELSLADRATLANMAPEYGATMGFVPLDGESMDYLRMSGRDLDHVEFVEAYAREQKLFRESGAPDPEYTDTLSLDMGTVVPSIAGPKRPQDRIQLTDAPAKWKEALQTLAGRNAKKKVPVTYGDQTFDLEDGAVVIAAITSCTNTSNPTVLIAAGLLAQKAVAAGLNTKPWVKTSLAPGSLVVQDYLAKADLLSPLEQLRFNIVGFGCTTCIGNSGPLPEPIAEAISANDLVATSALSGNRNFEGRISPHVKANYLASPPLVVAYALAGRIDFDFATEALGENKNGQPVYLKDLWPSNNEIREAMATAVTREMFVERYATVLNGDKNWNSIKVEDSELYNWSSESTYVRHPTFFEGMTSTIPDLKPIKGARCLALFGDSVTTDHISPAGVITKDGPAGRFLQQHNVEPVDFNSFGSRRGNHEVMMRGTFANIRIRNKLVPGVEGGYTRYLPTNEQMSIYDAAMKYQQDETDLIVIAGTEYGTGSSRDWAAKGTTLLGVKAVIVESFERIHRSNLVGVGVLPLQFLEGQNAASLGLDGTETFTILGIDATLQAQSKLNVTAESTDGRVTDFEVRVRLDTPIDVEYYQHGGILQYVLRDMA